MNVDVQSRGYEGYMKLAEVGRYDDALAIIQQYLKENPRDRQAWNDAGAVLFCLRRVEEAIVAFEKARNFSEGSVPGEILWNLCEAYLDGGYPGMATRQYDAMERMDLLTADLLNRTADSFLKQDNYGGAIEMLLRSLEISPNQDVLSPMLDVLRSKRPRVAVFAKSEDAGVLEVYEYARRRFPCELHVGRTVDTIRPILEQSSIAWFEGCEELVSTISRMPKVCKLIVRLRSGDVNRPAVSEVRWDQIDSVIISGSETDRARLIERVKDIDKHTRIAVVLDGVDLHTFHGSPKQRGKNLAYIGNLSATSNTMFLLQCMQKLNYIDNAYRLYIAGSFTDKAIERYTRYMIDQMRLSGVVFIEEKVQNLNGWLQDKHYIIGTGIDAQDWAGVLKGMAAGLRPLVADHPDIDGLIDREFVFDLAEDFCRQVVSQDYDSQRYRQIVESRFSSRNMLRGWNDEMHRLEKLVTSSRPPLSISSQEMAPIPPAGSNRSEIQNPLNVNAMPLPEAFRPIDSVVSSQTNSSAGGLPFAGSPHEFPTDQNRWMQSKNSSQASGSVYPIPSRSPVFVDRFSQSNPQVQSQDNGEPIPIVPIPPFNLNVSESENQTPPQMPWNPVTKQNTRSASPAHIAPRQGRSVDELAKEALKASQALAELARKKGEGNVSNPSDASVGNPMPGNGNVFGSFMDPVRDNRVNQVVSEFSDHNIPIDSHDNKAGDMQIPFSR